MHMRTWSLRALLLTIVIVFTTTRACPAADTPGVTAAVSANVQFAFDELKTVFEADTGIPVKGVIGSSGKLAAQIENGAPFDVLLSADTSYPEALQEKGLTYNEPRVYGYGALVLWTFSDLDLSQGVAILTAPAVKKIALPEPRTAPYGKEAVNTLKYYGLDQHIRKKLVYGESIAQANHFITSRAADIGFTAKSVVLASNMKDKGKWIEVDQHAYRPIAQAAVILKFAKKGHLISTQEFYNFLFSKKGQAILQKFGYTAAPALAGAGALQE